MPLIKLTSIEISVITDALNAYWNDADSRLKNEKHLGDLEKALLNETKNITHPIILKLSNL